MSVRGCYQGVTGFKEAEIRLRENNHDFTYLTRESDIKKGKFILSWLSKDGSIKHTILLQIHQQRITSRNWTRPWLWWRKWSYQMMNVSIQFHLVIVTPQSTAMVRWSQTNRLNLSWLWRNIESPMNRKSKIWRPEWKSWRSRSGLLTWAKPRLIN